MEKDTSLASAIYRQLFEEIRAGKYDSGMRLPTEMELMQHYYVSRITAKRALNELAKAGLVVRVPGRGTFLKGVDPVGHIRQVRSALFNLPGFSAWGAAQALGGASERAKQLGIALAATDAADNCANLAFDGHITYTVSGAPCLTAARKSQSSTVRTDVDAAGAVKEAADRLRAAGHTRIMLLTDDTVPGFAGAPCPTVKLAEGAPCIGSLERRSVQAVDSLPGVSAVILCAEFAGYALMHVRSELSLISVSPVKHAPEGTISQVRVPLYEAGARAVELLRESGKADKAPLLTEYIDRGTVKPYTP